MCQLSINNRNEAIYFAGKRRIIDFPANYIAGSNLHKLAANHTTLVFVSQKSLICSITDCKT